MYRIRKQQAFPFAVLMILYVYTTYLNTHSLPSTEHQVKEDKHVSSNSSSTIVSIESNHTDNSKGEKVQSDGNDDRREDTVHVAYCLYSDEPGLIAEFEVSLKSVLLNAPRKSDLQIHIICDSQAHSRLQKYFESSNLTSWESNIQILIRLYKLEENNIQEIRQWLKGISRFDMDHQHTIGSFFRLFVKDVLGSDISHVLYMDPDVVIMANLQGLWKHVDSNALFQWGENMCSGFLILNVQKMEEMHKIISSIDYPKLRKDSLDPNIKRAPMNDQLLFVGVNVTRPEVVQLLPMEWDISIANNIWRIKNQIVEKRPNIGMIHFNGGGISKEAFFDVHDFIQKEQFKGTFALATYYVRLPWPWAKYMVESQIGNDKSYTLKIEYSASKITISPFPGEIKKLRR